MTTIRQRRKQKPLKHAACLATTNDGYRSCMFGHQPQSRPSTHRCYGGEAVGASGLKTMTQQDRIHGALLARELFGSESEAAAALDIPISTYRRLLLRPKQPMLLDGLLERHEKGRLVS
nr:hypothetical protein [uncultured Cohaesibacter sp.]